MTTDFIQNDPARFYYGVISKILNYFAGVQFREEVRLAKIKFFDNAGILDENASNYELRMNQFFDWYFFTRELEGIGQTPLESYHISRELRFSSEELKLIENLQNHRHSLFQFIKIKNGDIYLKDLFRKGEKLVVHESPWTYGFDAEEIFESRLVPFEDTWVFMKGFCFHPREAQKFILSEIKKHIKDPDLNPEDLMLRLLRMRYKSERYRHVSVDAIYSNESKVGL